MTDEILIKYLLGESEIEEVALVEQWLKDSAPNQKYLLSLRGAWDNSGLLLKGLDPDLNKNPDQKASATIETGYRYNTEEQWLLLKSKIDSQDLLLQQVEPEQAVKQISESVGGIEASKSKVTSLNTLNDQHLQKIRGFKRWAWIAALCILALGTWTAYNGLFSDKVGAGNDLILTATASPVTDTLSDGSIITLNHYSRLQAPLNFKGRTREVTLKEGEAFFKVAHMDKKPFLVHIGNVAVKVLG
ncbi:MAG TPA: FecR family protein, partial [Arachidicoccus sp.]|nr:FecR family protein [Arachidicoccus sp.]